MTSKQFLTNSYIPKKTKKEKYKWFEHNLMTYFDDFKYDEFVSDGDGYFANVQVINLDIIHQVVQVVCYRIQKTIIRQSETRTLKITNKMLKKKQFRQQ